jgi:hypothetical protein
MWTVPQVHQTRREQLRQVLGRLEEVAKKQARLDDLEKAIVWVAVQDLRHLLATYEDKVNVQGPAAIAEVGFISIFPLGMFTGVALWTATRLLRGKRVPILMFLHYSTLCKVGYLAFSVLHCG